MTVPVGVLAFGATFAGLLKIPGVWEPFETWLRPWWSRSSTRPRRRWGTSAVAVTIGLLGVYLARRAF